MRREKISKEDRERICSFLSREARERESSWLELRVCDAIKKKNNKQKKRIRASARGGEKRERKEKEKNTKRFGSTVGKGYYHHAGGPKSMSGGRRHNGSHNGHHGSDAGMTAVEHNGHHPPREPRKEESTLVRRSFRRCGDEWRADSRRCVSGWLTVVCAAFFFLSHFIADFMPTKRVARSSRTRTENVRSTESRRGDLPSQKFDIARCGDFVFSLPHGENILYYYRYAFATDFNTRK